MTFKASNTTAFTSGMVAGALLSQIVQLDLPGFVMVVFCLLVIVLSAVPFAAGFNNRQTDDSKQQEAALAQVTNEAWLTRLPVWFVSLFISFIGFHHIHKFVSG